MNIWEEFIQRLGFSGVSLCCFTTRTKKENLKALESPREVVSQCKQIQQTSPVDLPNEMIVQIFNHLTSLPLKQPFSLEIIRPLLINMRVCHQWKRVATECLSKIYRSLMGEKPPLLSWSQSFHLLHDWVKQPAKLTHLSILPLEREPFEANCHVSLENPALTYDKVQINAIRVVLGAKILMATEVTQTERGENRFSPLWTAKVENPEKRLLVSTDQKLIATQHYVSREKEGISQRLCLFQIRSLQTGHLMGNVEIADGQSNRDSLQVQFDLTKFIYHSSAKDSIR